MTTAAAAAPPLRTVAFGDPDSAVWGTMLAGETTFLAVGGVDGATAVARFAIDGSSAGEDWRISADGVDLMLSGDGDAVAWSTSDGFAQLCRVSGRVVIGEHQHQFECEGIRGAHDAQQLTQFDSLREISAWFERDEGVAALALRPRKASGHGSDTVIASVIDPDGPARVAEPRVSTTYAAGGLPQRMSLELWIGEDDSEQYPRRFAGEASGPALSATVDGMELSAAPLRCHSRGRDGAGVYLLARRA